MLAGSRPQTASHSVTWWWAVQCSQQSGLTRLSSNSNSAYTNCPLPSGHLCGPELLSEQETSTIAVAPDDRRKDVCLQLHLDNLISCHSHFSLYWPWPVMFVLDTELVPGAGAVFQSDGLVEAAVVRAAVLLGWE